MQYVTCTEGNQLQATHALYIWAERPTSSQVPIYIAFHVFMAERRLWIPLARCPSLGCIGSVNVIFCNTGFKKRIEGGRKRKRRRIKFVKT